MKIKVDLQNNSYDVLISRNNIYELNKYIEDRAKVLIIKDQNVLIDKSKLLEVLKNNKTIIEDFEALEDNKAFTSYLKFQEILVKNEFSRSDYVVAIGGGVTGDLSGFVASTYKRGCRFINIPTTVLSMVDSSIGGKVAINFKGIKNVIGSFYHPSTVLIDLELLKTLDQRQYYNGIIEALKMGLLFDKELFQLIKIDPFKNIEEIIYRSLYQKAKIVNLDEKEQGLRKVLNFGHTFGHAIEALNFSKVYHGEAVAIGMLYFINDETLKEEVIAILERFNISLDIAYDINKVLELVKNDKKANSYGIEVITLNNIEEYEIKTMTIEELQIVLERGYK